MKDNLQNIWPVILKSVKVVKVKKGLWNYSRLKEAKETKIKHSMWFWTESYFDKGHYWGN